MILRALLATILLLGISVQPGEAQPKHRITDWKFWAHNTVNVGVSLLTTYTINRCMHDHGLGVCVGGDYGPFAAKEAIRNSISLSSFFSSYKWKEIDEEQNRKHKLWWLIPDANAAFNGVVILRNKERSFSPRQESESRNPLRSLPPR